MTVTDALHRLVVARVSIAITRDTFSLTPAARVPPVVRAYLAAGGWRALAAYLADWHEERAAVREYDGGCNRADAERLAAEDLATYLEGFADAGHEGAAAQGAA